MQLSTTILLIRGSSAVLALLAFFLVGIRLYAVSNKLIPMEEVNILYSLQLVFTMTMGLFLGYIAIKGRLPFSESDLNKSNRNNE
jgi:hypothetical protein